MSDLGTMSVSFGADLSGLTSGVASAKDQIQSVGSAAQDASGGFLGGIGSMIGGVVDFGSKVGLMVMGLQNLWNTATSGVGALLAPAAAAEQTGQAFETLMGSAKAASGELQTLNTFAAKTPFQTSDIDAAGEKLIAFGFKAQEVVPDVTAIGDALSSLGKTSGADLNSIVDIFGKIRAEGKLTGGTMMELSRWGIPAWNLLAEATGKSIPVLQKMVSAGLIPANEAIADLTTGIEKSPFGGGMARQANTLNGLISTFVSNVKLGWNALLGVQGGMVVKGSLFDVAEKGLAAVGNVLASGDFQKSLAGIGKDIADTLPQIAGLFKGINLGGMFSGLSGAGGGIHQFFITIQKDLSTINPQDVKTAFSDLFGILGHGADIVEHVGGLFLNLGKNLFENATKSGLLQTVLSDLSSIMATADTDVQEITGDISGFADGIFNAAQQSGAIQNVLQFLHDILPDVSTFVQEVGSDLDNDLLPPLESLVTNVGHAVGGFAQWLDKSGTAKNLIGSLGDTIGITASVAGTLVGWVADLVGWMTSGGPQTYILAGAIGVLGAAFLGLKIADTVQGFANMFSKLQEGDGIVANLADKFTNKLGKSFDDLLSNQFPNLKKNLDDLKTSAEDTGQAVSSTATQVETAETNMTTGPVQLSLWDDLDTKVASVGTTAEATATQVESIGTAASADVPEVAVASTDMETSVAGVGTAADDSALSVESIGTAADATKGSVAAAAGSMMSSLLPVIAIMGNIQQYQNDLAHPANTASVGDNIKNGLLDGIFPAGALANIQNAWNQFTQFISGKSSDMNKNVSASTSAMSKNVQNNFSSMESVGYSNTSSLSSTAQKMFSEMAGGINGTMSDLDQSTIGYFNDIAAYVDKMNALQQQAEANVRQTGSNTQGGYGGSTVGHHAMGGFNLPAGRSVVGEFGPEIVDVPGGSTIYSHGQSVAMASGSYPSASTYAAMSGSGSGSGQQVIQFYMDSTLMAQIVGNKQMKLIRLQQGIRQ